MKGRARLSDLLVIMQYYILMISEVYPGNPIYRTLVIFNIETLEVLL